MAFCRICTCGEKIVFEKRLSFPDNCPSCGRKLMDLVTYDENDPHVEELIKGNGNPDNAESKEKPISVSSENRRRKYYLKLSNGKEIEIPDGGCIIGRTEVGAEELAEFSSVSRQHLRVTPRLKIGVLIEDISSYGTLVDGQRIAKNSPVRVADGSKVTLCDLETVLVVKESED